MLKHTVLVLSLLLTLEFTSIVFLSEVLDILARMNVSMQRKLFDLSRLPVLLKITTDQLEHLKDKRSEWLGSVESEISLLKEKHDITLGTHGSARSRQSSITTTDEYRTLVAIPYVNSLLLNIKSRFTDKAVKIVTAMSIFIPSYYPLKHPYHHTAASKSRFLQSYMEKKQRLSMRG